MNAKQHKPLCSECFYFKVKRNEMNLEHGRATLDEGVAWCRKRNIFLVFLNRRDYIHDDKKPPLLRPRFRYLFKQAQECRYYDHFPWTDTL